MREWERQIQQVVIFIKMTKKKSNPRGLLVKQVFVTTKNDYRYY